MKVGRKILFAGTTSSGSSALFDYFRCFKNTCGMVTEMPRVWRKNLYPKWKQERFNHPEKYKVLLNNGIEQEARKRFGKKLEASVLLLNNVVTCLTLPGIKLLDNTLVFCVLRDPRSTWLRRRQLCIESGWPVDVNQFIKDYRVQRETFSNHLKGLKTNRNKIYVVNFEDFLLDLAFKRRVVEIAGFNIEEYPSNPKYAPIPKEQSILWHHFYVKQDEIDLIKQELLEYCHPRV